MTIAPVVLFVYRRPIHTEVVISSLLKNKLAKKTDLIIYSDAAKEIEHEMGVNSVREFIKKISGFNSISIIYRDFNYGLCKSIVRGVSEQLQINREVIVLEDDLVVSQNFLEYMNFFLNLYQDDEAVMSIHGYVYPSITPYPNTFFIKGADCWGWGTWRRAWKHYIDDPELLLREIKKNKLESKFDMDNSYPFTKMLKECVLGKNDSWAIRWYASSFLRNGLTLYPSKTLVDNIGFDGSGTHGGMLDKECIPLEKFSFVREKIEIVESDLGKKLMQKSMRATYGLSFYQKLKRFLKRCLSIL